MRQEEIRALEPRVRQYIHDLATRCDHASDVQRIWSLSEQRDALVAQLKETQQLSNIQTFRNADEMWTAMIRSCVEQGVHIKSREGGCMEVKDAHWVGRFPADMNLVMNPKRAFDPVYAAAEVLWYLSHSSATAMIEAYAPIYRKLWTDMVPGHEDFDNPALMMFGAVGGRLSKHDKCVDGAISRTVAWSDSQLLRAAKLLHKNHDTRRVTISLWRPEDLWDQDHYRNVPCYLGLCFRAQEGKLNCVCTMRSNDAWLGAPYDVFAFSCLQILLAEASGLKVGWYTHVCSSLHLYDKNLENAKAALDAHNGLASANEKHGWELTYASPRKMQLMVDYVLSKERTLRERTGHMSVDSAESMLRGEPRGMLMDLLSLCASRWVEGLEPSLSSRGLTILLKASIASRTTRSSQETAGPQGPPNRPPKDSAASQDDQGAPEGGLG